MSFVTVSRQRNKEFVQTVLAKEAAEIAAQEAEIQRRVKQEVAKLKENTIAEAKEAGEAAARAVMVPKEEKLTQAIAALSQAINQLSAPLAEKEQALAELVLDMAFQLACHIAGGESGQARTELAGLVTKLLRDAAADQSNRQTLQIRLHPTDLQIVQEKLPTTSAKLVADDSLTPGGALVELQAHGGDPLEKTEWDARLESRLEAIRAALSLPKKEAE